MSHEQLVADLARSIFGKNEKAANQIMAMFQEQSAEIARLQRELTEMRTALEHISETLPTCHHDHGHLQAIARAVLASTTFPKSYDALPISGRVDKGDGIAQDSASTTNRDDGFWKKTAKQLEEEGAYWP